MSAQTDVVINDGQATPVANTFSARGASMDLAVWKNLATGLDIGLPVITQSTRKSGKGATAVNKTEVRITMPILETISGSDGGFTPSPKVAYTMMAKLEVMAPVRSTSQNRKDIVAFAKNLLSLADASNPVRKAIVDFDLPT